MYDYASKAQHNKRNQNSTQKNKQQKPTVSKPLILFTVLALAGLVFGLYKLTAVKPEADAPVIVTVTKKSVPTRPKISIPVQEEYDFYNMLPKSEVIAPKVEAYTNKTDITAQQFHYFLQAGSFRNSAEADKLRAALLLEGLNVQTSKITSQSGSVWHRVMVGPFISRSKLNNAQDILANANTESLVIKVKR